MAFFRASSKGDGSTLTLDDFPGFQKNARGKIVPARP